MSTYITAGDGDLLLWNGNHFHIKCCQFMNISRYRMISECNDSTGVILIRKTYRNCCRTSSEVIKNYIKGSSCTISTLQGVVEYISICGWLEFSCSQSYHVEIYLIWCLITKEFEVRFRTTKVLMSWMSGLWLKLFLSLLNKNDV